MASGKEALQQLQWSTLVNNPAGLPPPRFLSPVIDAVEQVFVLQQEVFLIHLTQTKVMHLSEFGISLNET